MRQYELTIRIAQIHHLIEVRKYKKALAVVKTLDMRQVKGISDLSAIAEVYTKTEQFDAAKNTYLRIYKKSRTRRVLYRLIYLAIRTNALEEAEGYYQEFVEMSSSQRDVLILRYRIDKASGAPIGQLIEILESLKEEEYIEEWAYELAKLYFKAGRFDECRSECEDIKLWFGKGEIVERAKQLISSIEDDDQLPYIDDKDYTVEKEVPNPDDTGSLPDLTEYVESESTLQKHENSIAKKVKEAIGTRFEDDEFDDTFGDYFDDEDESSEYERDEAVDELLGMEAKDYDKEQTDSTKTMEENSLTEEEYSALLGTEYDGSTESQLQEDTLSYEYGDDESEEFDGVEMARKAIDGLQKLSGLWKHQSKDENDKTKTETKFNTKQGYEHHSQSGTGITQDLSKEIAAIYEAEKREQLKVHSVKVDDTKENESEEPVFISREAAMAPFDVEEIKNDLKDITANILGGKKKSIINSVADDWGNTRPIGSVVEEVNQNMKKQDLQQNEENIVSLERDNIRESDIPSEKSETELKLEKAAKMLGVKSNNIKIQEGINMSDYSTPENELPTTRALHKTFNDVLTLIDAEKDPSHFVIIGEDSDMIVTVSKKIVKVLKKNGFLSNGRIASIQAKQLNMMDFDGCREQLKGSCLLVNDAADLFFPTITKIFELMDEFYGDFIVILADEGNTLDQMFRFAPALAKKFKYVIDISRYTAEDLG